MKRLYLFLCVALLLCCMSVGAQSKASASFPQSGTLPIIYITTENLQDITSKENYLKAEFSIDNSGRGDIEGLPWATAPVTLQIKGHGNYTFRGFEKKPYRLKFDKKQKFLGMPANKHFLLMAGADDDLGFLRNLVGYELSRRIGLDYTTAAEPVELYLNGDYRGLYFYTEKLRVDKERVNIVEQADEETDPANITGGWLVEIDNYDTDPHINVSMGDKNMILTHHTPEILSDVQRDYLQSQWDAIAKALYVDDENSTEWEQYIDIESLAKVYIVRELLQDEEGFHGSCYVYKDRGDDTKWTFSPLWDFGNAYQNRNLQQYIFTKPEFTCYVIDRAWKFKHFREKVKELWQQFYVSADGYQTMDNYIDEMANKLSSAVVADYNRWNGKGNVCTTNDEAGKASEFMRLLHQKASWLCQQWGNGGWVESDEATVYVHSADDTAPYIYAWNGTSFGDWPGKQLTDSKYVGGQLFYYVTVKKGSSIIFSSVADGTPQDQVASEAQKTQTENINNVSKDVYYEFYQSNKQADKKNGLYKDITSQVTTGISLPVMPSANAQNIAVRYNMEGQRVDANYHGIVICGGKKYVVR